MIFHLMVREHLGAAKVEAFCAECARKTHLKPLREPGDGSRHPVNGLLMAGPPVTRESAHGQCSNCGESDARVGYLRTCAGCNGFYLLDHCETEWPPPAWFCRRAGCQESARRAASR